MKMLDTHEIIHHNAHPLTSRQDRLIPTDCTILIIEENVSHYVFLASVLGTLGAYCEWKASGYEVAEYANTIPHLDLILMDIFLPYEDGFSAVRNIRASGQFQCIPIIAMGVDAKIEHMEMARNSGFDGFIGNPLELDKFTPQIVEILNGDSVWELN
jgi:CheY-like chemotaxis protein